jgi:hypothetical protein
MPTQSYGDYANYGVDPWAGIELNERPWYDPVLRDVYMRQSVYSQHATMKVDLAGPKARTIYFNEVIPPRPNIAPIGNRQMESTRLYSDSYQKEVVTQRYGNGMSFHNEDAMFNYWQSQGGGVGPGLMPYLMNVNGGLAQVIVDHLDILARNAYFEHPAPMMGLNNASGFGAITDDDKFSTDVLDEIRLMFRDMQKPFSPVAMNTFTGDEIMAITSAGAIYDIQRESGAVNSGPTFLEVQKYQQNNPILRGEIGAWRGFRFVDNPFSKLWNTGSIGIRANITAALKPGDGAPNPTTTKVEGSRRVGQPGATHFIQLNDAAGLEPGMMITIHREKHDATSLLEYTTASGGARGVLNGVVHDDPMAQNVEIHSVDLALDRITIKEPYMMTDAAVNGGQGLETDLGGSVYGYVTFGDTIHTALFLTRNSANAIVAGVAQPPKLYTPKPYDDYESVYRLSYDLWLKYQLWEARNYALFYFRAPNKTFGRAIYR